MNAFEIFGLPISVNIDSGNLRKIYIQMQQNAHPDQGGNTIESEQINKAYTILKNRDSRIKLILELNQVDTNDTSTLPTGFLFEMMEISEMMELDSPDIVKLKIEGLLNHSNTEFQEISSSFDQSQENVLKLAVWYQKNKYYTRLNKNSQGIQEI
ncbi:MAG: hypothetical protein NBV77_01340 [Bacteroidia bacterium]|nr:hypothetical protein [Bacteroidia bacterium]